MSSLVTNSTGNCKLGLGHDCRRVRSHRRRDSTRQLSRVGVGGMYWAMGITVRETQMRIKDAATSKRARYDIIFLRYRYTS